jgi:hypothetical protein
VLKSNFYAPTASCTHVGIIPTPRRSMRQPSIRAASGLEDGNTRSNPNPNPNHRQRTWPSPASPIRLRMSMTNASALLSISDFQFCSSATARPIFTKR